MTDEKEQLIAQWKKAIAEVQTFVEMLIEADGESVLGVPVTITKADKDAS